VLKHNRPRNEKGRDRLRFSILKRRKSGGRSCRIIPLSQGREVTAQAANGRASCGLVVGLAPVSPIVRAGLASPIGRSCRIIPLSQGREVTAQAANGRASCGLVVGLAPVSPIVRGGLAGLASPIVRRRPTGAPLRGLVVGLAPCLSDRARRPTSRRNDGQGRAVFTVLSSVLRLVSPIVRAGLASPIGRSRRIIPLSQGREVTAQAANVTPA